jgi:hypothetical protein
MKSPNSFGGHFRDASAAWVVGADDEPVSVAAAWLQYRVARAVWDVIGQGTVTVEDIARELGQSSEAQRKKLAGVQPASLRDLVAWVMLAGRPGFDVLPREDHDLFPDAAWKMLSGWRVGQTRLPHFRAIDTPAWDLLAANLASNLAAMEVRSRTHLVTRDWLRQTAVTHMAEVGLESQRMRLRSFDEIEGLQLGLSNAVVVLFELITDVEAIDTERAIAALQRVRKSVANLAVSSEQGILVVAAVGSVAKSLIAEIVPRQDDSSQFTLGPYEPRESSENADWWSRHRVELGLIAAEDSAPGRSIHTFEVLKASVV